MGDHVRPESANMMGRNTHLRARSERAPLAAEEVRMAVVHHRVERRVSEEDGSTLRSSVDANLGFDSVIERC